MKARWYAAVFLLTALVMAASFPPLFAAEWEKLVTAAQKEGAVTVYGNMPPKVRDKLVAAFKARYGIKVDLTTGRPAELIARIKGERNAGLFLVDVGFFGSTNVTNDLEPLRIIQPLEPMLVLPEVKDPKNWRGGKLPFLDKDKSAFMMVMMANSFYQRNTGLVKENEINDSLDLLNPQWKRKIVMSDPSISGASVSWFTWMLAEVLGREKGLQFMKDLAEQEPVITRDERQMVEWVARGKYAVSIAPSMSIPADFIKMGAPLAFIDVKEPRSLSAGFGIVNVFKDAPHTHAAKLFLNWMLSKEGASVYAPTVQYPSLRVDVPPEGILPIMMPRSNDIFPEGKYKEYTEMKGEMRKVAAKIFTARTK